MSLYSQENIRIHRGSRALYSEQLTSIRRAFNLQVLPPDAALSLLRAYRVPKPQRTDKQERSRLIAWIGGYFAVLQPQNNLYPLSWIRLAVAHTPISSAVLRRPGSDYTRRRAPAAGWLFRFCPPILRLQILQIAFTPSSISCRSGAAGACPCLS